MKFINGNTTKARRISDIIIKNTNFVLSWLESIKAELNFTVGEYEEFDKYRNMNSKWIICAYSDRSINDESSVKFSFILPVVM